MIPGPLSLALQGTAGWPSGLSRSTDGPAITSTPQSLAALGWLALC